ncbi:hypothetical protein J7K99_07130 [bacterium]|nr:hypothetical protein [bacterium]
MAAKKLQAILDQMAEQLSDFIATAVVDPDGLPIAGTGKTNIDISVPSGMFSQAKQQIDKAFEVSGWGTTQEYLFSGDDTIVMLMSLAQEHYLWISVDSSANFGMTRAIIKKFLPQIKEALAG